MAAGENIVLIGFMGTGKSTVSEYLGEKYGMDIVEMDHVLVQREKMSIPEIFEKYGEEYFRDRETALLVELQKRTNVVISCGGGAVLRDRNVSEMKKNGKIVLLTASPETVYARVKDDDERPLLAGRKNVEGIRELMEQRRARYEAAADIVICTDDKTTAEVCKELMEYV